MNNKLFSIERRIRDETQPLTLNEAEVWAASADEAIHCVIDYCYADFGNKKVGGRFGDWVVTDSKELIDKPVIVAMRYSDDI